MTNTTFDYHEAFSRNIGWVTREEQDILRGKRIATAGLGGVGGNHLITMTRLGIGAFNLAEFDHFDLANFNRQAGANVTTLKQSKLDVLTKLALDINPELKLTTFAEGLTDANMDEFLKDADLYIDSLDFFALEIRRKIFAACAEKGIPAITVAPVGLGCTMFNFMPGKMTFEDYFQLDGHDTNEQYLRFLVGLTPTRLQNGYLVQPDAVDLFQQRVPSTPMAIQLCSGVAVSQAFKILLNRGKVLAAPRGMQIDVYKNKTAVTWRPFGNRNPLHRLAIALGRKRFLAVMQESEPRETRKLSTIEQILDRARWAPSGDNAQSWRFEIVGPQEVIIHAWDTRADVVYDLQGHASLVGIGALLESIALAASEYGLAVEITSEGEEAPGKYRYKARFNDSDAASPDPLVPYIPVRTTQRRSMPMQPLSDTHKQQLAEALPEGYSVIWFEDYKQRWSVSKLLWKNARLRLTLPEAHGAHTRALDWDNALSPDKMPVKSLGVDLLTQKLMRWCMQSWKRVDFFNRYLGGTLLPRIQMDLVPGMRCGAHFILLATQAPQEQDDFIAAGRATQRFWLTATKLGINLQPEYTPLVFQEYSARKVAFSDNADALGAADQIAAGLAALMPEQDSHTAVYMGRVGYGPRAEFRSIRLDLKDLIHKPHVTDDSGSLSENGSP